MPYSDDLYSAWDGGESDAESSGSGSNHAGIRALETQIQHPLRGFHAPSPQAGDVPGLDVEPDVLSPTDGYFRTTQPPSAHVPHVPNIWVRDPSFGPESTADNKAREAQQERTARGDNSAELRSQRRASSFAFDDPRPIHDSVRDAHHLPSSSSLTPYHLTTTNSCAQHAPQHVTYNHRHLITPGEAPPAYTPSPTSSSTSPSSPNSYSTFSPQSQPATVMGHDENQGLLAREPQSMGNPDDTSDESPFWSRYWTSRDLRQRALKGAKFALISILLFIITLGFLTSCISSARDQNLDSPGNTPKEPTTKKPPASGFPSKGKVPMEYPDLNKNFEWGSNHCKKEQIRRETEKFDISFSTEKDLVITQDIADEPHSNPNVNVQGSVIFRRTGAGTPGPSAVVDVVVNDDRLDVTTKWDTATQTLDVTVPRSVPWFEDKSRACVSVTITVWVPEDGSLRSLGVSTVHLHINLLDNLSMEISERAKLSSVVGAITAAATGSESRDDSIIDVGAPDSFHFQSRLIEVETTAAPIKGSWPLYDYLYMQSVSGNIRVCVEPKDEDKETPKPATLYIKSLSGTVEFREPVHAAIDAFQAQGDFDADLRAEAVLPPRDYRIDVYTTSGNIWAVAAFSSTCGFKTTSGKIAVELLPVFDSSMGEDKGREAFLSTTSTSGSNDIAVLKPLWIDSTRGIYVGLLPLPHTPSVPWIPKDRERYVPIGKGDPYKWNPGSIVSSRGEGEALAPASVQTSQERTEATARALRNLRSEHGTISGSVRLHYPAVWEGDIAMGATTGRLSARGEGVRIIKKDDHGWRRHVLLAKKGEDGGSKITVDAISGNLDVLVGKE